MRIHYILNLGLLIQNEIPSYWLCWTDSSQIVKDLVQQNHTTYSCYHDQKPLQGIPTHLDLSDENQIIEILQK